MPATLDDDTEPLLQKRPAPGCAGAPPAKRLRGARPEPCIYPKLGTEDCVRQDVKTAADEQPVSAVVVVYVPTAVCALRKPCG